MPGDAFDVASHSRDVCKPAFELGLAQVRCHCIGEGSRLTAQEPNQLAELGASPGDRTSQTGAECRPELVGYRGEWSH